MKNIKETSKLYHQELTENIMPFWSKNSIDYKHGGFLFFTDRDGTVIDTDKGVWHQGRGTWMYATLYNELEKKEEWLAAAINGADYLLNHCFDKDGRMYFQMNQEGDPIRKRRYAYSESFAAIAFAALYRATGESKYKTKAVECYTIFRDYVNGKLKTTEKFTNTRPTRGMGGSMIGIVTAQEMRKNLEDESYTEHITEWINDIKTYFIKPDLKAVMEVVDKNGGILDHFDGRMLNPGHAIEEAWFIMSEGQHRNNDPELIKLGCDMLDWMWERGWDKEYGGITYFVDLKGLPVQEYWHDMKFWWPQNETIIATLMAYSLTGKEKYAKMHEMIHDYTFEHFPDREYGEWFGYLHRDGRVSQMAKGNLFKGPFHIPRMLLKAHQICEELNMRE